MVFFPFLFFFPDVTFPLIPNNYERPILCEINYFFTPTRKQSPDILFIIHSSAVLSKECQTTPFNSVKQIFKCFLNIVHIDFL